MANLNRVNNESSEKLASFLDILLLESQICPTHSFKMESDADFWLISQLIIEEENESEAESIPDYDNFNSSGK